MTVAELVRRVLEAGGELYLSKAGELLGRGIPPDLHPELRRRRVEVAAELRRARLTRITGAPVPNRDADGDRLVRTHRNELVTARDYLEGWQAEGRRPS